MVPADETFEGTFPFAPHFSEAAGFRMHYVDEGAGEVVVCLHGEPTWSYLYRRMIPGLAAKYRVVVPDHMGFGKSETPQDRTYTLQTHVENLAALLDDLALQGVTFVAQDWGGPIAAAYTVRHPERVKRLFFANTLAGYGRVGHDVPETTSSRWFQWIADGMETGRTHEVLRNLGSTVLSVMQLIGFTNTAGVDDTWVRAYSAPFPDASSSVGALEFPLDVHTGRIAPYVLDGLTGLQALQAKPAMLAEGLEDHAIPPARAIADFRALWPAGPVVELPGVGHFCQEDAPATLVALIDAFVQTNP
jgi:cis-3-alkyl-4-acyloxetan-2-one decarboxylase